MQRIWRTGLLLGGLFLLLLPGNLWGQEIPVIRVAAFNYFPAIFLDTDNNVRGFYVDMLDEIAAREQIRFEYVFGSWSEGLERLRAGAVDLVTSAAYTEERATVMDFGQQVLLTVWGELYIPQDSPIISIRDLQDQSIAVMRGDHNAHIFKEHLSKFGVSSQFIEFVDFDEVLGAVKGQQVSAGVVSSVFGDAAAKQYQLQSSGVAFHPFDIYFAAAKGQHAELLSLLDGYLTAWRNDSTSVYFQSRLTWGAAQDPETQIPAWVTRLVVAAAVILPIGLMFIVLLRYQVHRATQQLKNREVELQKSNDMIRLLLDSTAEAIYGLDPQGICTFCNAACVRILGYDNADQLIGRNMHDLIHHSQADGAAMPATECKLLKGLGQQIHSDSEVFWRSDGSSFPVEYWSYPIRQSGKNLGLVISFVDITERKRAEETRRQSDERFRIAQDMSPDGFTILRPVRDSQGRVIDFTWVYENASIAKLNGTDPQKVVGQSLLELFPGHRDTQFMKVYQQVAESGTSITFEESYSGESMQAQVWFRIVVVPMADNIAILAQDITERKQAEEAIKAAHEQLEVKNEELEQFVYSVSHDLKSPLVTVKSFVGMLRQDLLTADQSQIDEDLDYIDKAADKMQQLLEALLQYSRIGRFDSPAQTLAACQPVKNCITALAGILGRHQIHVSIGALPQRLHGNPLHFERIWQNLIENAVKYRGVQTHPQIEIGAIRQAQDIVFYVRDNGIGIAPEHHQRIFNLFSQLNPDIEGSGLGLALVKKIVDLYQGRIWVESAGKGKGSCFYFTLPGALQ